MKHFFKVTALAVTVFSLFSCSSKLKAQNKKEHLRNKDAYENYLLLSKYNEKKKQAVSQFVKNLSIEEKLSQIFMINLEKDDKFFPVEWFECVESVESVQSVERNSEGPGGSSDREFWRSRRR